MSAIPWTYTVDGDDLVVRNITATCFGGRWDAGDNGETESGVKTAGNETTLMGVALPIRSTEKATRDSPLAFRGPHIPWHTPVMVWREADGESTAIRCELVDNGPNVDEFPTHALDLTPAPAKHFAPSIPIEKIANRFSENGFSYRVVGGTKFIS